MPASRRSSVDLPAPLCPTSPTRSPWRSDSVTSRSASTTGTFASVMRPPARPSTDFFRDRFLASKIGKSTEAFRTSIETITSLPWLASSHPVGDAGAVVAQRDQGQGPADHGDHADDGPVRPALDPAHQRRTEDLDEVVKGVELRQLL